MKAPAGLDGAYLRQASSRCKPDIQSLFHTIYEERVSGLQEGPRLSDQVILDCLVVTI